jgi:hypothetical protein
VIKNIVCMGLFLLLFYTNVEAVEIKVNTNGQEASGTITINMNYNCEDGRIALVAHSLGLYGQQFKSKIPINIKTSNELEYKPVTINGTEIKSWSNQVINEVVTVNWNVDFSKSIKQPYVGNVSFAIYKYAGEGSGILLIIYIDPEIEVEWNKVIK